MDNTAAIVKNSLLSDRNTEQGQTLKMISSKRGGFHYHGAFIRLFGITGTKDLRQFHDRSAITLQLFV